jgi:hypothetical protein
MNSRRFIDQLKWHARRNVGAVAAPAWLMNPAAITLPVPWDPALASAMGPARGKRSLNMGLPSLLRLLFFCPVLGAEGGLVKKENSVASDVATSFGAGGHLRRGWNRISPPRRKWIFPYRPMKRDAAYKCGEQIKSCSARSNFPFTEFRR